MSDITSKILKTIKSQQIEKIPRWKFVLKRVFIWGALIAAILMAAFAISMMMMQMVDVEWDLLPKVSPMPFFGFFKLIPYFWLVVASLLFGFVYFDFKNIKGGYRYAGAAIIAVSLLISVLIGACIYFFRTPEYAEGLFRKVPMYRQLHMGREMMWNVPGSGVLAGTVLDIDEDKMLILRDFGEDVWVVDISRADVQQGAKIFIGMEIRVVGKELEPGKFFADAIRIPKGGPRGW